MLPKVESCIYIGVPRDHPKDPLRVLTREEDTLKTRDVKWKAMLSQMFPLRNPPFAERNDRSGEKEKPSDNEVGKIFPLGGR